MQKNLKSNMEQLFLGFDTSCYTTSVSCVDSKGIILDKRIMLSVPKGERGLRQSDALFQHNRNMPVLLDSLFHEIDPECIAGVGVSQKPVFAEDSYMPVFLCGTLTAKAVAASRRLEPLLLNHQMGHIRAAVYGENEDLLNCPQFIAIHISGGTTDILRVTTEECSINGIEILGRSTDLHAGQFVDRVGVKLGLGFPAGKELENLARMASKKQIKVPSSVKKLNCSFSGAETFLDQCILKENANEIAYAVYDCLSRTLQKMIQNTHSETGLNRFLLCGGVSSSGLLRELLRQRIKEDIQLCFGKSELSSDNAVGIALSSRDLLCRMQK